MGASNPFKNFDNWLKNDGDNGGSTGDEAQLGNNNFIDSPSSDPHSVTLLGATIFEVKTPHNAALVGQNNCIDDGAVGVYGESHGKPKAIGVAGACDPTQYGCGVVGTATASSIDLPKVGTDLAKVGLGAGVFGAGDGVGVYGASLPAATWDLSLAPTIGSGVFGRGDTVGVKGECANDAGYGCGVAGTRTAASIDLPQVGSGAGVFGAGDGVGVYGASLAVSGWDFTLGPTIGSGVLGRGDAIGVMGECFNDAGYGVLGVNDGAGSGVFGASGKGPGGRFSSGDLSQDGSSSNGGIAQLRLVPSADSVFPVNAQLGDLYAHVGQDANRAVVATLWLCVEKGVKGPVQWAQITTKGFFAGGTNIP